MAKQLNVNLAFNADTSQAKAQIQDLQSQLQKLAMDPTSGGKFKLTDDLQKASVAAAELSAHLNKATNQKTGTLDFTKLNKSIQDSGNTLSKYGAQLRSMGPAGQQAFATLATSVAQSEIPLRRSNKLLTEMATTLKNTARWQLSSSLLHGFMGTLQSAYGYAQDLNKSLTNIRIVSGQSTEQMAAFAEKANRAAKALSTTTTAYTDAALIYYQQGLNEKDVLERTDTTVKMSNVTGEGVEEVSSYMTAIWNNFNASGDQAVEHYADIMTKLGAETAASTDEIAAGLSKFSAVAETIELSFEMASSAVTAIVDQTRESPEVVGTALKTIFSRVEGLKQGETLEDGVDLNKYSEGLRKVGVNIMDQSGQLKDMDTILKEIGNKWETLDKNSQVALAQTVAGVRQYNQFMALFDNWDHVEENLTMAATAHGTLNEQAEIYAESWEGAQKHLKASAQGIYQDLLNDEFFIDMTNGLAEVLDYVDQLIGALGGLDGVLSTIGVLVTKIFAKQMAEGLKNAAYNMQMMTEKGREAQKQQKKEFIDNAIADMHPDAANKVGGMGVAESKARAESMRNQLTLQQDMMDNSDKMSDLELEVNNILMERLELLSQLKADKAKEVDAAQEERSNAAMALRADAVETARMGGDITPEKNKEITAQMTQALQGSRSDVAANGVIQETLQKITKEGEITEQSLGAIRIALKRLNKDSQGCLDDLLNDLDNIPRDAEEAAAKLKQIGESSEEVMKHAVDNQMANAGVDLTTSRENIDKYIESEKKAIATKKELTGITKEEGKVIQSTSDNIHNAKGVQASWADGVITVANAFSTASMVINSFQGVVNTLKNPDMTGWEKFISILGSLGMTIPMVVSTLKTLTTAESLAGVQALANAAAEKIETLATVGNTAAKVANSEAAEEVAKDTTKEAMARKLNEEAAEGEAGAVGKSTIAKGKGTSALKGYADAGKKVLGSIGKVIAAHPVVAAVVVAAGIAIWAGVKAWNADAKAAEKAAEAAHKAGEAYDKVKASYDETKGHLDAYKSAEESLKNLTKGTQEWTDAINESNTAVLELLDKFPELAEHVDNVDGRLVIDSEGQELIQQKSDAQLDAAMNGKLLADGRANEAQLKSDTTDLRREINGLTNSGNYYQDSAKEGSGGGGWVSEKNLNAAIEAINTQGSGFMADVGQIQEVLGVSKSVAEALKENSTEIIGLAGEISANTAAQEIKNAEMAKGYLEEDEAYQNASVEDQAFIAELAGKQLSDEANKLYDSTYKDGMGVTDKQAQEEYAEMIGATDVKDKSGNKAEYLIDGQWQEISDEAARMAIATEAASSSLEGFSERVLVAMEMVEDKVEGLEGFSHEDQQQMTQAITGFADGEVGDLSQLSDKELTAVGDLQFTEEEAKALGYDTAKQLMTAIDDAVADETEKRASERAEQVENAPDTLLNYLNNLDTETLRNDERDAINNAGGVDALVKDSGVDLEGLMSEYGVSFEEMLAEIDWSTMDKDDVAGWFKNALEEGAASAEVKKEEGDVEGNYASDASEYGIDEESYRALTERIQENAEASDDYADSLKDQEGAAQDVAKSILRYDKALQAIAESGEDWQDILENGSDQEIAENIDDIATAYGDMLDLDPGALSNDFLENAENMELMRQAAEGNQEAYEELQRLAGEDILTQCGIDTEQYASDLASIEAMKVNGENFLDIEAGATLDDTDFLNKLTEMVANAGMSAEEAQAYLASMGIDAEVTEDTTNSVENGEIGGAIPRIAWEDHTFDLPIVGEKTFKIPKIDWDPTTEGIQTRKQVKAHGIKVTSAKKSTGGAIKHKQSSHGGGTAGKKGKSGGGGKGGGSTKKKNSGKKKSVKDETERYHEIKNTLEDLGKQYDAINKQRERAWGADKLKLIDQEIDKTKEAMEAQKQYLSEIRSNLKTDETNIQKFGAEFDDMGNISNYDQIVKDAVEKYNKAVAEFNTKNTDDEDAKKKMDAAEAEYKQFQDYLKQYEETHDLLIDEEQAMIDYQNQVYDLQLEAVDYEVQTLTDLIDHQKDMIDYMMDKLEDKAHSAAEAIALMGETMTQIVGDAEAGVKGQIDVYKDGIMGILNNHVESGDITQASVDAFVAGGMSDFSMFEGNLQLTADEVEAMQGYIDGLMDQNSQLIELRRNVHASLVDGFSEWVDELNNGIEKIDHLSEVTSGYMDIIDIVGQKSLGITDELMADLHKSQTASANAALAASKDTLDAMKTSREGVLAQVQAAQQALEDARNSGDQDAIDKAETTLKLWQDDLNEIDEQIADQTEDFMDRWAAAAEAAAAEYEAAMERAIRAAENMMAGTSGTLENLMENMDRQQEVDELYLKDYQQIYELSKLTRDINNSIDDTDNIKSKRELKKLTDEINQIQESGKQLSEYDLEYLQKKYELKVAELALEEAQDAKSQVRMQRDSEGNWGYVYTADESSVEDAEQTYEDKLYEMQELSSNYINDLNYQLVENEQQRLDAIRNLKLTDFENEAEYYAALEELNLHYDTIRDYCYQQLEGTMANNASLYENDWTAYSEATGYRISESHKFVDDFSETMLSTKTGFDNFQTFQTNLNTAIGTVSDGETEGTGLLGALSGAFHGYQANLDTTMQAAGTTMETFGEKVDEVVNGENGVIAQTGKLAGDIKTKSEEMVTDVEKIQTAVETFESEYQTKTQAIIDKNETLAASFQKVLQEWAKYEEKDSDNDGNPDTPTDGDGGDGNGGDGNGGNNDGNKAVTWKRAKAAYSKINAGKWGNGLNNRIKKGKKDGFTEKEVKAGQKLINYVYPKSKGGYGYSWETAKKKMGYDTGGYTGNWGTKEGKLAFLHQKEIVLNAQDTENFLAAIEIVREIANKIDLNAASAMTGRAMQSSQISDHAQTLQQHVEISASFPNATNHSEIEEAFRNLVNTASQYANTKRK